MLDIKFIRNHLEAVKAGATKKHIELNFDHLIKLDNERVAVLQQVEELRREQNELGKQIPNLGGEAKQEMLVKLTDLKKTLQAKESDLKKITASWRALMMKVPNIPDISVPEGKGEKDNVVINEWGTKPKFDFEPKDHVELMTDLQMVDLERGVKVHGFRGYFLTGAGADLTWALWNLARDKWREHGFTPTIAPAILKPHLFYHTGHLPAEAEDLFATQDDDRLSGTAEVAMMGYYMDEVLPKAKLPAKFISYSPCYRREAGSYSKDTKGIIRVHEFQKLEQLVLCEARHDESVQWFEKLNNYFETFIQSLNLPYQQLLICGGDLSSSKVKQYDTEAWFPSQKKYRELSSVSYFHDFQTRRFNIRYKDDDGTIRYAHSLNCTAVATPRILVAIVENYQQADGSIKIPEILVPYMNGQTVISKQ